MIKNIIITKQDIEQVIREGFGFLNGAQCPMARKVSDVLGQRVDVTTEWVFKKGIGFPGELIARISPVFQESDYKEVYRTGEPFHTKLYVYDK